MATLFADHALTPGGWAQNVRVSIGPDGRIAQVQAGAIRPGANGIHRAVLLPAPANLHCHAFQRAMAGLAEARGPQGQDSFWTWRQLMYRFVERLGPEAVQIIAEMVQIETLESGFAAIGEFHYLHHQPGGASYDDPGEMCGRIVAAAAHTGIGLTLLPVFYCQAGLGGGAPEGSQRRFGAGLDVFGEIMARARVHLGTLPPDAVLGIAPHSLRAVSRDMLKEALALYPDGPVHMHAAEQSAEVADVEAAYGSRPVQWLLDNAAVDRRWCLVHATHMTDTETARLAASGAVAGLCPITEANLGDGIFNGAAYLTANGAFGVGSDSNIRICLTGELRLLEYTQRLRAGARCVLCAPSRSTGRTLFDAAVTGGARALARPTGIETGAWADLIVLDGNLQGISGDAILDRWIFARGIHVRDVWAAGRHVVQDGRHVRRSKIEARFRETVDNLCGEL